MSAEHSNLRPSGAEASTAACNQEETNVPMVPMPTDDSAAPSSRDVPKLVFQRDDHVATAYKVRDLLATAPHLFERDGVVRIVGHETSVKIERLNRDMVAIEAAKLARIERYSNASNGPESVPASLPNEACGKYLALRGEYGLRPLAGITHGPIVHGDGTFTIKGGYDPVTQLWQANVPALIVSRFPSFDEALGALARLRKRFQTFPFADAKTTRCPSLGIPVVRQDENPGLDESSYLVGLLTAIVRASLPLAPGMVIRAAFQSGSGSGKGMLAKAACILATGMTPNAITAGHDPAETDKRLTAALKDGEPMIFLDNVNSTTLRSDTLASGITEPQARLRPLGSSTTIAVMNRSFIVLTGNGLDLSEDLVSRFIGVDLDPRTDDPETRPMPGGFLEGVKRDRATLLSDALTIVRYGIQNGRPGLPLRNFDDWAKWCRDGLLGLGATDPVVRVAKVKAGDPLREHNAAIVNAWHEAHGTASVTVKDLQAEVVRLIAPGANRQALAAAVKKLEGMRLGNTQIVVAKPATNNTPTFYQLRVEQD